MSKPRTKDFNSFYNNSSITLWFDPAILVAVKVKKLTCALAVKARIASDHLKSRISSQVLFLFYIFGFLTDEMFSGASL